MKLGRAKRKNKEKSVLLMSNKMSSYRRRGLIKLTGFVKSSFPTKYLEAPLFQKRMTAHLFDPLILRIQNKVANQKGKLLSQGGQLILIHHVLCCMTTHILAVLSIPLVVINKINFIISSFFWKESNGRARMKQKAWKKICNPRRKGEPA